MPITPKPVNPDTRRSRRQIGKKLEGQRLEASGFGVHRGRLQLTWEDGQILEVFAAEGGKLQFRLYPREGFVIEEE